MAQKLSKEKAKPSENLKPSNPKSARPNETPTQPTRSQSAPSQARRGQSKPSQSPHSQPARLQSALEQPSLKKAERIQRKGPSAETGPQTKSTQTTDSKTKPPKRKQSSASSGSSASRSASRSASQADSQSDSQPVSQAVLRSVSASDAATGDVKSRKSNSQKKKSAAAKNENKKSIDAEIILDGDAGDEIPSFKDIAPADGSKELAIQEPPELFGMHESSFREPKEIKIAGANKTLSVRDPLSLYLSEIRKYPLLTREEETALAKKYFETKDPEAAQKLVRSNLRFVVKVAADYSRFSAKMIDLIQEGNVGLMHAVREFNPYKGARLITYAVWWIKGYIQEYLMRQYSMVRIGTTQNQRKLFYQLQKEREQLEAMGTEPNLALLSHRLGIPEDEVSEMAQRMSGRDVSLDRPADDESTTPLTDLLKKDDGSMPIDERIAMEEQVQILHESIEKLRPLLSEKEKIILDERILSDEPLTLQEIGEKYKITREAVRQTEVRVLNKIKEKITGNL